MSKYKVNFYKGSYGDRQRAANRDKAVLYVEQHFNAGSDKATYAVANVATNAGKTSINIAEKYAARVVAKCGASVKKADGEHTIRDGVFFGGWDGKRGNGNLSATNMPAVLLEPLFASNPKQAAFIRSADGQLALAECLVETIKEFFPLGGLIAFSVGHKYKMPDIDRGVPLAGGGTEADYAEKVLLKAKELLESN